MPREVIVDEVGVGNGTIVEQELARRLHAASIAQVTIERSVLGARAGAVLLRPDPVRHAARAAPQPRSIFSKSTASAASPCAPRTGRRSLEISAPSAPIASLIEQQRARRDELFAAGGPVDHLYPPDKGWVRIDPTTRFEQVSLVDLALLAQDPSTLAGMLLRLTEDDVAEGEVGGDALSRKFSDVATLFAALDPRVSRVMFGKLARAVLDLQPEPRQTLLRKTILPGLLDGTIDGTVLQGLSRHRPRGIALPAARSRNGRAGSRHDGARAPRPLGRAPGGAAAAGAVARGRAHGRQGARMPGSTPTRAS